MNGSRVIPYDELAPTSSKETAASLWRLLAEFSRAVARDDPIAHRYLLLLRFILANAIALALVGAAAGQGWIGVILAADQGGLCRAIVGVFLVGVVWSGRRVLELSRGLNELERFASVPGAPAPAYLAAVAGRAGDTRGPDQWHVGRPVHHFGRLPPERLAHDQRPPAGKRHGQVTDRHRRTGRARCTGLTPSKTTPPTPCFAT